MSASKQIYLEGDFAAGVFLSDTHLLHPHHLYTMYSYMHFFTQGGGMGGGGDKSEGYRGNSSQSWVENTNMTDCISSP